MPRTAKRRTQKTSVKVRSLLSRREASDLEALFKVFASTTRLRILHALVRSPQLCVSDLSEAVGMTPQAVSNQLQRLAERGIVGSTRNGNNVHYRIVDACVPRLLALGLCLQQDAKERTE